MTRTLPECLGEAELAFAVVAFLLADAAEGAAWQLGGDPGATRVIFSRTWVPVLPKGPFFQPINGCAKWH